MLISHFTLGVSGNGSVKTKECRNRVVVDHRGDASCLSLALHFFFFYKSKQIVFLNGFSVIFNIHVTIFYESLYLNSIQLVAAMFECFLISQ